MSHLHKLSSIGFLSPVFQISEDILANCFQMRGYRSLEYAPKNPLLAASHFSVGAHFLLPRTSLQLTLFLTRSPLSELFTPA